MSRRMSDRYEMSVRPGTPAPVVPTLVWGRDRLPTRCGQCGSRLLSRDYPDGFQKVGTVTCVTCGQYALLVHGGLPSGRTRG